MRFSHAPTEPGSLLDMPSGCPLLVEDLQGSPSIRSRLYSMGILPGTELEVRCQACGKGSVCVRVRQCSLVLGEAMARAIRCRPAGCPHSGQGRRHHHHHHHAWAWPGKAGVCPAPDGVDVLDVAECNCPREQGGAHGAATDGGRIPN